MLVEAVKSDAFNLTRWPPFHNEVIPHLRHDRHLERMMAGIPYLVVATDINGYNEDSMRDILYSVAVLRDFEGE